MLSRFRLFTSINPPSGDICANRSGTEVLLQGKSCPELKNPMNFALYHFRIHQNRPNVSNRRILIRKIAIVRNDAEYEGKMQCKGFYK